MQKIIINTMNKQILFNSKDHSYNGKKITYTSVSTLIGRYKKPYNREYWSTYKAYEKLLGKDTFRDIRKKLGYKMEDSSLFKDLESLVTKSDLDKTLSSILSEWEYEKDKSIKKGNDYHSFKEDQAKELGFCENPYTGKEFPTIHSTKIEYKNNIEYRSPTVVKLYDLEDGFHPELILWDDESRLAGQSDLVFIETINGDRFFDIDDFKTNKKIVKNSIFGKMKDPLGHLDCCNYNHYRLQISMYAKLLEKAGFIPRHLGFRHLNTAYRFDYMKKEVESIMPNYYDF